MARVAIVVEFNIKPGQHAAFDRLIREHARKTLDEDRAANGSTCCSRSVGTARPTRAA